MEDFVKEKVESIKKTYSHSGAYIVTLKPEYKFNSDAAPRSMAFGSKKDAMDMIWQAQKVTS